MDYNEKTDISNNTTEIRRLEIKIESNKKIITIVSVVSIISLVTALVAIVI